MKTTLVIPLSSEVRDGLDLQRFDKILWPSIRQRTHDGILEEVIIVCRERDRHKIPHAGEDLICTITDEELLGPFIGLYHNSWLRQQALKLFVHARVRTDTYLVLDADCFMAKDLCEHDLFPEGKARLGVEEIEGIHADWWAQSSALLHREDTSPPEWPYIGVTPQILYTRIVAGLLSELENIHQKDPKEILGKNEFTEFTLYWLYLLRVERPEDLYFMNDERLRLSRGVWTTSKTPITDLKLLLLEGRICFGLVQSLLGIDPEYIAEQLFYGWADTNKLFEGKSHGEKTR